MDIFSCGKMMEGMPSAGMPVGGNPGNESGIKQEQASIQGDLMGMTNQPSGPNPKMVGNSVSAHLGGPK